MVQLRTEPLACLADKEKRFFANVAANKVIFFVFPMSICYLVNKFHATEET